MRDSERDELFARARRAASPTDDDRRRVRAAIVRRLRAGALVTVGVTAAKAAASGLPVASGLGTGVSTLAAAKVVVGVVAVAAVVTVSAVVGNVLLSRTDGATTSRPADTASASMVPTVPARTATASVTTLAVSVEAPSPPTVPVVRPSVAAMPADAPPVIPLVALSAPRVAVATPTPRVASPAVTAAGSSLPLAPEDAERAATPVAPAPLASAAVADTAAETALVAEMQAALRDGDVHRVLVLVGEHARRFPHGVWAPEREGARTLALCTGADRSSAARIGQAFLDTHPRSPLAGRVRAACGLHLDDR